MCKAVDTKKQDMPEKLFPKFVDFDQRQPKKKEGGTEPLPEPQNLVSLPKAMPAGVPCPGGSLIPPAPYTQLLLARVTTSL